jgi:hypothetical protein
MNPSGRRIVRTLVAMSAAAALALPATAGASSRSSHPTGKSSDGKQHRPAGTGSGRRIH